MDIIKLFWLLLVVDRCFNVFAVEEKYEYLAGLVHAAVAGFGTKEDLLIEVICTKTDDELQNIAEAFKKRYDRDMKTVVLDDLSGSMLLMFQAIFQVTNLTIQHFSTNEEHLSTRKLPKKTPRSFSIREKVNGELTKKFSSTSSHSDLETT